MNKVACFLALVLFSCASAKKQQEAISTNEIDRILKTLSSDDMKGRASFTDGAEKAATFIEAEFAKIGLQPMAGQSSYRQNFSVSRIQTSSTNVTINNQVIENNRIAVLADQPSLDWNTNVEVVQINAGEDLFSKYGEIIKSNRHVLVLVDSSFAGEFGKLRDYLAQGRIVDQLNEKLAAVFVLGGQQAGTYTVKIENKNEKLPLNNIVGIIPGRSRANELVIFSAHYDHIGILPAVNGDSIANGADDDASGTTAVISLAQHFKRLNNNERTLLFVAFTAEELGMVGSKYFSKQLNADSVTAMFNIEMIGKESRFGKNAAFITGFERSDMGKIMQQNLQGTPFTIHPDPYTEQRLFYRSDNATLAALGVPAHTISTSQIDVDKYYHTVDDELETLNAENLKSAIQAIALSAKTIVAGMQTPARVEKLVE